MRVKEEEDIAIRVMRQPPLSPYQTMSPRSDDAVEIAAVKLMVSNKVQVPDFRVLV